MILNRFFSAQKKTPVFFKKLVWLERILQGLQCLLYAWLMIYNKNLLHAMKERYDELRQGHIFWSFPLKKPFM